jgi:hypothetical protein
MACRRVKKSAGPGVLFVVFELADALLVVAD